jgi:hypothetical protein
MSFFTYFPCCPCIPQLNDQKTKPESTVELGTKLVEQRTQQAAQHTLEPPPPNVIENYRPQSPPHHYIQIERCDSPQHSETSIPNTISTHAQTSWTSYLPKFPHWS